MPTLVTITWGKKSLLKYYLVVGKGNQGFPRKREREKERGYKERFQEVIGLGCRKMEEEPQKEFERSRGELAHWGEHLRKRGRQLADEAWEKVTGLSGCKVTSGGKRKLCWEIESCSCSHMAEALLLSWHWQWAWLSLPFPFLLLLGVLVTPGTFRARASLKDVREQGMTCQEPGWESSRTESLGRKPNNKTNKQRTTTGSPVFT